MIDILPAILAHTEEEFVEKFERVRGLGCRVHVDAMDGIFVPNNTWTPIEKIPHIMDDVPYSMHLMDANPEHAAPMWAVTSSERVFFHIEATTKEELIMRAVEENDDGSHMIGIAVNPETPISRLSRILPKLTHALIMGVAPGRSGQEFQEIAIDKIRELMKLKPGLDILVDGGVKPHNIRRIAEAGASGVVVGSALTEADDPAAALQRFKDAVS